MALKVYEAADQVPEPLRGDYAKADDGKFRPVIEDVKDGWAYHDAGKLVSSVNAARTERDEAKRLAKQFDGLDPAKAREALEKYEQMSTWTPEGKVREQIEAREKALSDKYGKETAKERAAREKAVAALENELIAGRAALAVQKLDGIPGAAEALMPHIRKRAKVIEGDDGDYRLQVLDEQGNRAMTLRSGKSGDMDIEELVESFKGHDVFGHFFKGSGSAGSGAPSSNRPGNRGAFTISRSEARDPRIYEARKAEATKAGATLTFTD